ncbi:hypothetical protein NA57DRAFT_70079 [Rhizodiscina lignyota]|uniref:ER transporter 6TM N-terminal domain-containing protein n=1 Tax=Rhizodiscina lignyota TaxID=1504668 RepID=A0A9P4MB18_9PEZI|nr:hypothetical protein NA57DRAFT_70079 [Rhizodiscina lignyota]
MAEDAMLDGQPGKYEKGEDSGLSGEDASTSAGQERDKKEEVSPKRSFGEKVKGMWAKTGLNVPTVLLMAKGGLPPVIALAMFQSTSVAALFPTLGYLLGIVSVLGFCIMPRAKFIQTMFLDVISVCLGTAIGLLESYCAVKARQHTTPPLPPGATPPLVPPYNSSASAVCAIWLFVQVYAVNCFRAKFPQFAFPTIIYCIFANVTSTYATQFPTVKYAMSFEKTLLEVFLLGLGIATAVSFLIFPVSTRKTVLKQFEAYIGGMRGCLKAEVAYFQSLEDAESFRASITQAKEDEAERTPQAKAVKGAVNALQAQHGKLHGDLTFAKREIAFGKLGANELKSMFEMHRRCILPLIGLSAVIDIFEHLNELNAINETAPEGGWQEAEEELRKQTVEDWVDYMRHLHVNFADFADVIDEGLEHVLLVLQFKKPEKKKQKKGEPDAAASGNEDIEERAEDTRPGSTGFAEYLERRANKFHSGKEIALRTWCEHRGIDLAPDFFDHPATATYSLHVGEQDETYQRHQIRQRQLYMLLYMEYLLHQTAKSVLAYVRFVDDVKSSGKLSRKRFLMPGKKRIIKWIQSIFKTQDVPDDNDHTGPDVGGNTKSVELGSAYRQRKDPEHLPPENWIERFGDNIRVIPAFFRSPESAFGLRVALATISIGIVAFLADTQHWFLEQRGIWALIMVAISMNPTAGSSIFSFLLRVIGTTFAMLVSWCIWYIPDQKTPGILVFLWLFVTMALFIPLKKPQFIIVGMISIVTTTMIIGYQIEVRKVGKQRATSNGQPFYPVYEFAPYRLATVIVGLTTAFIWTVIPYPITEHSQIRKGLGGALYLSANYYSIVHELANSRIRGDEGNPDDKKSPGHRLEKARVKVFSKMMLALNGLRAYSGFQKWEVPIGGRFPRKEYNGIINHVQGILSFMSLVAFASQSFRQTEQEPGSHWTEDFRRVMESANFTSHNITSLLSLMSAAISGGLPLPPYLKTPKPYQLSDRLEEIDKDILSVRHINEPCYAAFAVIQISTRCIVRDLDHLLTHVKSLVGELDFSFHVVSTSDDSSEITLWETAKTVRTREKRD